jgi:hypothetical protein
MHALSGNVPSVQVWSRPVGTQYHSRNFTGGGEFDRRSTGKLSKRRDKRLRQSLLPSILEGLKQLEPQRK